VELACGASIRLILAPGSAALRLEIVVGVKPSTCWWLGTVTTPLMKSVKWSVQPVTVWSRPSTDDCCSGVQRFFSVSYQKIRRSRSGVPSGSR
jgi:hypothetical protein